MIYLGGKSRQGKRLAQFLNRVLDRLGHPPYYEPFCGAAGVLRLISPEGPRIASDRNPDIILLLEAVRDGWSPPTEMSRELWMQLKHDPEPSPLRSFAGFGCSIFGAWFNTYDHIQDKRYPNSNPPTPQALKSARDLEAMRPQLQGVEFRTGDYRALLSPGSVAPGSVVYCDPPYPTLNSATTYKNWMDRPFDYPAFWSWAEALTLSGVYVYVSAFRPHVGWKSVLDLSMQKMREPKIIQEECLTRMDVDVVAASPLSVLPT